jgi:DNA-binding GntR family transcriptional regulator
VPQPRSTRTQETYRYLLEEIMRGRWPAGDIVSTNALAEELRLSRTPVLQALKQLESEGIVEIVPQVGCRILHATGSGLADLFALRSGLDGVAATAAAIKLDRDGFTALEVTLRRLDEAADEGDLQAYAQLNEHFHALVVEGAGMPRLAEATRTMWAQIRSQLTRLDTSEEQIEASRAEHRELYEALRSRAPGRARRAAERHARLSAARFSVGLDPWAATQLCHGAAVYDGDKAYLAATVPFVKLGLDAGEQVLAVTTVRNAELLARALGPQAGEVEFRDADEWYLVPSHTLLSYERYIQQAESERVRILGEVAWGGESLAPVSEWIRYEAALNSAFALQPATILCSYDARALPAEIVDGARRTHPTLFDGDVPASNADYTDPDELIRDLDREGFPPPAAPTDALPIQGNLRDVRTFVLTLAKRAGVSGRPLQGLFLAVQQVTGAVMTNGAGRGSIRAWIDEGSLVFEVRDDAPGVGNPLVGQFASDPGMLLEPRGLWLARLLCDLVEVRASDRGLVIRLHAALR